MTSVDAVMRVIRARCSDALAPSDLLAVEAALSGRDDVAVLVDVADRIEDVLAAMAQRFDRIEERIGRIEEDA